MPTGKEVEREIDVLIRARYPIIYIVSWEENRVEEALRRIAGSKKQLLIWTVTRPFGANRIVTEDGGRDQAIAALDYILGDVSKAATPTIFLLKDFDPYLDDPLTVRRLRDLSFALKRSYHTLILLSPLLRVPPHLEKEITVVDYDPPAIEDLAGVLEELVRRVQNNPKIVVSLDEPHREALLKAALGLTLDEAENVFAKALALNGRLDNMDVQIVLSEKKQIIRKTGMLEYYEAEEQFTDVGGMDLLKDWLRKRTSAFTERARKFGLPVPRGILLLGVQGCGKSLCAKSVSALWNLPLLRFDVGNVFGKWIGESEANMRKALKVAESIAPCVLWLDELEKAFGGGKDDESGVTLRVFGSFLTWLQEKKSAVFVIATANDISALPPELMRKGRLDEIFFVDLPSTQERREIFEIHVRKRKRDPSKFDLIKLADHSSGFGGAEIEQAIVAGLYDAFDAGRDIETEDILGNLKSTVPLSQTMREDIVALRLWADTRARWASSEKFEAEVLSPPVLEEVLDDWSREPELPNVPPSDQASRV